MGDPVRIARVRDRLSEPLNNAEPTIGLGEQHDPAIGTDPPAVKSGGDLLAADGWKAERQKVIVGHGGRGLPRSQQRVGFQQPNPTPDQKLTLLPPPPIRPRHEYDGLAVLGSWRASPWPPAQPSAGWREARAPHRRNRPPPSRRCRHTPGATPVGLKHRSALSR